MKRTTCRLHMLLKSAGVILIFLALVIIFGEGTRLRKARDYIKYDILKMNWNNHRGESSGYQRSRLRFCARQLRTIAEKESTSLAVAFDSLQFREAVGNPVDMYGQPLKVIEDATRMFKLVSPGADGKLNTGDDLSVDIPD